MKLKKCLAAAAIMLGLGTMCCISAAAEESELPKTVHVCVHDPSVFEDTDGTFYVLGSHTASASSEDLIEWKQLNFDYGKGTGFRFTET